VQNVRLSADLGQLAITVKKSFEFGGQEPNSAGAFYM
jgi:hypothetical protein